MILIQRPTSSFHTCWHKQAAFQRVWSLSSLAMDSAKAEQVKLHQLSWCCDLVAVLVTSCGKVYWDDKLESIGKSEHSSIHGCCKVLSALVASLRRCNCEKEWKMERQVVTRITTLERGLMPEAINRLLHFGR